MNLKTLKAFEFEDEKSWVTEDLNLVKDNLAGFKSPDKMIAIVNEATSPNGKSFDKNPFCENDVDGSVCILDTEQAQMMFDKMSTSFKGKKMAKDLSGVGGEGVVAIWKINDEISAVFVGENSQSHIVEDVWYDMCRVNKIPPYENDKSFSSSMFSAQKAINEAREFVSSSLSSLIVSPVKKSKLSI